MGHLDRFMTVTKPNSDGLINWLASPDYFITAPKVHERKFNAIYQITATRTVPPTGTKSMWAAGRRAGT